MKIVPKEIAERIGEYMYDTINRKAVSLMCNPQRNGDYVISDDLYNLVRTALKDRVILKDVADGSFTDTTSERTNIREVRLLS